MENILSLQDTDLNAMSNLLLQMQLYEKENSIINCECNAHVIKLLS